MSGIDTPIHVEIGVDTGPSVTVDEFIHAVREAAKGLTSAYIDAHEYFESTRVEVCGWRPRDSEERADYERHERFQWLAAKATYERGLGKYESEDQ